MEETTLLLYDNGDYTRIIGILSKPYLHTNLFPALARKYGFFTYTVRDLQDIIEFIVNIPEEKYTIRFKNPGMGVVKSSTYNCSENLSNKIHELWDKLLYE